MQWSTPPRSHKLTAASWLRGKDTSCESWGTEKPWYLSQKIYSAFNKTMIQRLCSGARLPSRTTDSCKSVTRNKYPMWILRYKKPWYHPQKYTLPLIKPWFCDYAVEHASPIAQLTAASWRCGNSSPCDFWDTEKPWYHFQKYTSPSIKPWFSDYAVERAFQVAQLTAVSWWHGKNTSCEFLGTENHDATPKNILRLQ